jgi:transcriptional antiterminator NusG
VGPKSNAKDDQQKVVPRKIFPGYVLIDMIVDERTWYAVRNTPGVTGFVGGIGNTGSNSIKPIPLSDDEVARILKMQPKEEGAAPEQEEAAPLVHMECPVDLNDTVRIKAPGFNDMVGTVAEINNDQQKIKVMIEMFGRVTPIEVNFTQVEAIE